MGAVTIEFPVLIADIGGTNARFQIVENAEKPVVAFPSVKTAEFDSIETAIEQTVLQQTALEPKSALIAAAGPITPEGVKFTNCHWRVKPDHMLALGSFQQLILLNDFEAQALALPWLNEKDYNTIGAKNYVDGAKTTRTKLVLGPGTGLGVAFLINADGSWIPVAGEGGHVDLGPRLDQQGAREWAIWQNLMQKSGRVCAEKILSGPGLLRLYQALCDVDNAAMQFVEPAKISMAALAKTDPKAIEALELFCRCLGRFAGDMALTAMAEGGVYIAGGIGQKIMPFLKDSGFRAAFDDKAPYEALLRQIPVHVVMHELPALVGLEAFVRHRDHYLMNLEHRFWCK